MSEQSVGDVGRRRLFRYGAVAAVAVVSAGLGAAGSAALLGPGEGAVSAGRAEPPVRTPDEALARLRAGNERWVAGTARHPNQSLARRRAVAGKQQPYAVVMGCIDSRVAPELVFDAGIGDLFVLRTAAHTLDDLIEGSDEYGPAENGTPVLLVLGHQRCGAVTAAVETLLRHGHAHGHIEDIVEEIEPAFRAARASGASGPDLVERTIREHIRLTVQELSRDDLLTPLVARRALRVLGGYYSLDTGRVEFLPS